MPSDALDADATSNPVFTGRPMSASNPLAKDTIIKETAIKAAIFAGGESRRFSYQTKALIELAGKRLLDHCLDNLHRQGIHDIAVAANNRRDILDQGYNCIPESDIDKGGPLRALHSAMCWSATGKNETLLLTLPCDTPCLPVNLVNELLKVWQLLRVDCVIAANLGKFHPTIGLWRPELHQRLANHLLHTENLSLKHWLCQCNHLILDFGMSVGDPFANINTSDDLDKIKAHLKHQKNTQN